jgi:hypothetical protein
MSENDVKIAGFKIRDNSQPLGYRSLYHRGATDEK